MAKYEPKSLRNIAFIGHGGTGKTSLCESILYVAGKTDRAGRVDDGSSTMDYEPEEQRRHISIGAALNFVDWEKHKINLIDTPGDANFSYDTKSCLRIVDAAVVLVDAVGGVEFQTEKVWTYADEFSLPRLVFINRMDRERADFAQAMDSLKNRLRVKTTPVCLPIGKEDQFKGIVDLIQMKALLFEGDKGAVKTADIPADLRDEAEQYRETMVEDIAESDEALMEKYLDVGTLSAEELTDGLRKGVCAGSVIPVLCGSALKHIGTAPLMSLIAQTFPSPVDRGPVTGLKPGSSRSMTARVASGVTSWGLTPVPPVVTTRSSPWAARAIRVRSISRRSSGMIRVATTGMPTPSSIRTHSAPLRSSRSPRAPLSLRVTTAARKSIRPLPSWIRR